MASLRSTYSASERKTRASVPCANVAGSSISWANASAPSSLPNGSELVGKVAVHRVGEVIDVSRMVYAVILLESPTCRKRRGRSGARTRAAAGAQRRLLISKEDNSADHDPHGLPYAQLSETPADPQSE